MEGFAAPGKGHNAGAGAGGLPPEGAASPSPTARRKGKPVVRSPRSKRPKAVTRDGAEDHLSALGKLVEGAFPDPTHFFDHGLALLVQQLGVDRAVMSRLTDLGWEAFWWATAEGTGPDAAVHEAGTSFAPHVLDNPTRTLVIRDAFVEPAWRDHGAFQRHGVRAYLGAPLASSGRFLGVLSASSSRAKAWSKAEIAMVSALANLFSKTLEVEHLKHELHQTRDALDLTAAVVEDSALESARTHLPNRHYLAIWLKANLYLARRRGEEMAVVTWQMTPDLERRRALRDIAEALRGEDLMVDLGEGGFLLLLPRTSQEGAQILLERIRLRLGPIPMGATLWNPLHKADRNDLSLRNATKRADLALARSRELAKGTQASAVWDLLILNPEDLADTTNPW